MCRIAFAIDAASVVDVAAVEIVVVVVGNCGRWCGRIRSERDLSQAYRTVAVVVVLAAVALAVALVVATKTHKWWRDDGVIVVVLVLDRVSRKFVGFAAELSKLFAVAAACCKSTLVAVPYHRSVVVVVAVAENSREKSLDQ